MTSTLHVVGAGLSGLAAAFAAARAGRRVILHEAAPQAGGRCRSFHCPVLDRVVDNGSHLVLGVNRNALAFAAAIGGAVNPLPPELHFHDFRRGWVVRPPSLGSGVAETVKALLPWRETSVARHLDATRSYTRLWEPLCLAALNTAADEASARLFARLLRMVLMAGKAGFVPHAFPHGLSAAFAEPAIAALRGLGADIRFCRRLVGTGERVLRFQDGEEVLGPHDRAILALPPDGPTRAIVNAHFRLDGPVPMAPPFLGLVGGTAQWLFKRDDVLSVTVSAADGLAALPGEQIARLLWADCARALDLSAAMPPFRIIKERRATLAHTPKVAARRVHLHPLGPWLRLAGDWTLPGLPCTIEAAITSGLQAARWALACDDLSFA